MFLIKNWNFLSKNRVCLKYFLISDHYDQSLTTLVLKDERIFPIEIFIECYYYNR